MSYLKSVSAIVTNPTSVSYLEVQKKDGQVSRRVKMVTCFIKYRLLFEILILKT
jgi:hypothetical protein